MPKILIIILNYNGWDDTKECLESLNKVEYENFEVILIDNGSAEKPPEIGGQFSNLKITQVFNEQNLGFAGGNNQGIKMALAQGVEYILLLNNDTLVEPDFLTRMVEVANKGGQHIGIVGPLMYFYDSRAATGAKLIWSAGGKVAANYKGELIGYNQPDSGQFKKPVHVDYISGTCLLIKKAVIEKIGLISEDYFLYYEDVDWCTRARATGYECLLVPEARIYHKVSKSTQEFSYPYIYYHVRNNLLFASRFGPGIMVFFMSIWILLKQVIKLIFGYKRQWALPSRRAVEDFWAGKKGKMEGYY